LHRQAGAILAEVYEASLEPHLEELARHCAEGGQLEQAAGYAFRAAQWNDLVFNWTRSTVLYRTALALWDQAGGHEADIATGCERLANLLVNVGLEPERVHELLLRALEYHEKAGNRRRVAKLHARISRAYFLVTDLGIVDVARGLDHYEKARVILEVEPVGAALGWVYDGLSAISFVLNQAGEAVEWAQRGLEVAERLNEPILHANAQYHLAIGTLSGDVAAGQAALEECWRSSIEHGSPWAADAGRFVAAFVAINLRDPRAALAWAAREPDFRTLMSSYWLPPLVVEAHARLGDFAAAERVCCEVQNSWAALGQPSHGNFPGALAALAHWRGDWPEAQRQLEAGVAWARRSGWLIAGTAAAHRLGEVYLEQGNPSGAEEILRWALDLHRAGSQVLGQIAVVCTLIELTTRQGRLDEARAYLAEAQEILGRPEDWRGLPAGVALAECQVRAAEGRWVEAEAAFQRAIDISQRYELCWDEAKVYHAWGSALLDAEKTSADLSKRLLARGLFSQALTLWETMGAQPYAERCRRRLAELG
jgi:tetratricopeptide (TPR) repeat protein